MTLDEAGENIGATVFYWNGVQYERGKIVRTNHSYVFVDYGDRGLLATPASYLTFEEGVEP